jgi:transcriptional regulator with XRE-family HTH domain
MSQVTLTTLQVKLARFKGQLPEIARVSGVSYYTVQRIARGDYGSSPTLRVVDALTAACREVKVRPRKGKRVS